MGKAKGPKKERKGSPEMPSQPNSPRPKAMHELMTSEIVKILVGPNRENFFNAAFQSSLRESHEQAINLPEESAGAFALLVPWIYGSPLPIDAHVKLHTYIELYGLAQKFCMEDLGNQAMDLIKCPVKVSRSLVEPDAVYWGYRLTSPGCGLRRFLGGLMAYRMLKPEGGPLLESVLEEFVQSVVEIEDLARDFMFVLNKYRVQRYTTPYQQPDCFYHEHRHTATCTNAIAGS